MTEAVTTAGAFSNPFLLRYPSFTEPLTMFCKTAFAAAKERLPEGTELKREHVLAYVLKFIANWKNYAAMEALIPAFILGKSMLLDLPLPSLLAVFPQIEAFTLEFLSAPSIPTFIAMLYLEVLKQLISGCVENGVLPPNSKLPGFLALLFGDSRRQVVLITHQILSLIAGHEADTIRDILSEEAREEDTSDTDEGNNNTQKSKQVNISEHGYSCLQIIKSILSLLTCEGTINITRLTLYNLKVTESSSSDIQVNFLPNLIYAASGGPAVYSDDDERPMSAGCMLVVRLLQLIFIPDVSAGALHVINAILSVGEPLDTSLLTLIDISFRELPLDEATVNQVLLAYENVAFYIARRMQKAARGPRTFQALGSLFEYYALFLKQLHLLFKASAKPELASKSLSLISAAVFSHRAIVAGHLLPAFEAMITTIVATIDPVNMDSFFGKVGIGFSGIAENCFSVEQGEEPDHNAVIAGLKPFFTALVSAARHTENPVCIALISQFIRPMHLQLAFQSFDCGLITGDGTPGLADLVNRPAGATDLWLLSHFAKCKSASLVFLQTNIIEGILNHPILTKVNTSMRSILVDQLWAIISEVTKCPVISDFLGYSQDSGCALQNAASKQAVDAFCETLISNLFQASESRIFRASATALSNLLRFLSGIQEDVMQLVASISKTMLVFQKRAISSDPSASSEAYDSLMKIINNGASINLSPATLTNMKHMEGVISFAGKFLAPQILTPLLNKLLSSNVQNYDLYLALLPPTIAISTRALTTTVCSNVIKRIIANQGLQTTLFDLLSNIITGSISAGNFTPLGEQTAETFLELDTKLAAIQSVPAQKLHYKILRFLVKLSNRDKPELTQAILQAIGPPSNETFRGGALQRQRFGLYADILRCSGDLKLEVTGVLCNFAQSIYMCINDTNMRVRHMASEMIKAATVKSCKQVCNSELPGSLRSNINDAVQKIAICLQPPAESSLDIWANYAYILQIIMISMTEVVRGVLITDFNTLLEQQIDISALNCAHPLFIDTAKQILQTVRTHLVLEKEQHTITNEKTSEEETIYRYRYVLPLQPVTARRMLNFISAFVSAAGPAELLAMAEEIPDILLRLVIGSTNSPHRMVVNNILLQLGLALGYSYARDVYEEAFSRIMRDMMDYMVSHSDTPIVNIDSEVLMAVREGGAEACISARRMVSAVLSKFRHKAADQMIGRFTLPNYMDVSLTVPEDMRGRMRVYSGDDSDYIDLYKNIVDKDATVVDLDEEEHKHMRHPEPAEDPDDPFLNNKKFGKSLNSAMAVLLDETVERDNLRPEHLQKIARLKESDAILNRTVNEIKRVNQRKQYSSGKLKVIHTGHEFSSKRAGGDVRDANKADPYAYLPLLTGKHISKHDRARLRAGMSLVTQKRTRDERIAKKQTLSHAEKRAMIRHGHVVPHPRNKRHDKRN